MQHDTGRNFRLNSYVQSDKISNLYNQSVDRIEKQFVETRATDKSGKIGSEIGLGKILSFLGVDLSLSSELKLKDAKSTQVISELAPEQKLEIVLRYLSKENLLFDLNECLDSHRIIPTGNLVKFRGKAKLDFFNPNDDPVDSQSKILVSGSIGLFEFSFLCSRKYFIGESSVEFDIYEKIVQNIEGIASVIEIERKNKKVILNPICF